MLENIITRHVRSQEQYKKDTGLSSPLMAQRNGGFEVWILGSAYSGESDRTGLEQGLILQRNQWPVCAGIRKNMLRCVKYPPVRYFSEDMADLHWQTTPARDLYN